jgi:hypothetical protein
VTPTDQLKSADVNANRYSVLDFVVHGLEPGELAEALAAQKGRKSQWLGPRLRSQRIWASDKGNEIEDKRGSSVYEMDEMAV